MTGSVASLRRRRGSARRLLCPIVDPVAGGEQQPLPLMDPAPPSSVRRPSRRIQLRRRAALVRAVVASSSARPAIRRSRIPLLEVAAVFLPRPPLQLVADPAASDPPVADPAPRPSPVACRPPSPPARPPRASSAVAVGAVPTRPRHRAPIRPPLLTPPVCRECSVLLCICDNCYAFVLGAS